MKIQINCITCRAEYSRIQTIKNTWGKHWTDLIFFADFEEGDDVIKTTDNSTYWGCEEKMVNRFKQIKNKNNYDWYFFIDDDTFVNVSNMVNFVSQLDNNNAYGYSTTGCLNFPFFQGGAGFFISQKTFNKITIDSISIKGTGYSDTVACQILKENNINLSFNNDILNSDEAVNLNNEKFKTAITFHKIKTIETMQQYYNCAYLK